MAIEDDPSPYLSLLASVSEAVYDARRRFFRANFDGYVEDTYYYVPDGGYYCWPAQTDGAFEGFRELLPGEERALEPLLDEGFELLGVGVGRVACRFPPSDGEDLAVKIGRCGMGDAYGTGRRNNLVEARVSNAHGHETVPILPSLYCDPAGKFAVFPHADPVAEDEVSEARANDLAAAVERAVPSLRVEELALPKNLCRWNGDLYTLDYAEFGEIEYPLGVPGHVDPERVIREVDDRRKGGEKRDIDAPPRLVSPAVADE